MLTPKQAMFVREYLIDLNATQAAIRAGYTLKYANTNAQKTLQNTTIQKAIQKAMDERSKRTEITADKVLQELSHIAFDDIKNYLSFRTEKTVIAHDKDTGEPIIDYQTIVELKDSDTIDTRSISEISTGPNGVFRFKQYCKDVALVNLGKHLGMFSDKLELTGKDGGAVQVSLSLEDKLKLIAELRNANKGN